MKPDIREQSYLVAKIGVLAIGEGSIYGHTFRIGHPAALPGRISAKIRAFGLSCGFSEALIRPPAHPTLGVAL